MAKRKLDPNYKLDSSKSISSSDYQQQPSGTGSANVPDRQVTGG